MEHYLADSQRPPLSPKWIGFAFLCALYILLFVLLCQTPLYSIEGAHNDRLFSADDIYYTNYFFSTTMDESPRIVKHPDGCSPALNLPSSAPSACVITTS